MYIVHYLLTLVSSHCIRGSVSFGMWTW